MVSCALFACLMLVCCLAAYFWVDGWLAFVFCLVGCAWLSGVWLVVLAGFGDFVYLVVAVLGVFGLLGCVLL